LTAAIIGIAALLVVLVTIALLYNRLVGARNRTRYAWSDIDALLVRRAQAIPRLADVVRAAMAHERGVFEQVAAARAGLTPLAGSGPTDQRYAAEQRLGEAGSTLIARVEDYPELRAQEAVNELVTALHDIEGDLRRARIVYNRTVQTYQDARLAFPSSLVAGAFGFRPVPYFGDAAG